MMRLAHVLSSLEIGGVQVWLKHLTQAILQRTGGACQIDCVTLIRAGGEMEPEFRSLGCGIFHVPLRGRRLDRTGFALLRTLRRGQYDAVHCHTNYIAGVVLPCAALAGAGRRLMHVHSSRFHFRPESGWRNAAAERALKWAALRFSTACIGCSATALDAFFGAGARTGKARIVHCAIPLGECEAAAQESRQALRQRLAWPAQARILLHVGRHSPEKNLSFLLRVFRALAARRDDIFLMLAGAGPLTEQLECEAAAAGIGARVAFLRQRRDVPSLMRASDLLLLPSATEGLPMVMIEALAVCLPAVAADHIDRAVDLVPGMVAWHGLEAGAESWAQLIAQRLEAAHPPPAACLDSVRNSAFNIDRCADTLLELYGHREYARG
jgi:glycosyltransferase involved in cell wall biosynthesis